MTRDEAVSIIQTQLAFRSDKAAEIIVALKGQQERMEHALELPFFLRSEVSDINTTVDEERLEVPSDFLREWDEDALWYFNSAAADASKWTRVVKEELELLRRNDDFAGEGPPEAYALDHKYFRIFPTPDLAYPMKMIYYGQEAVLDTDIENGWLEHVPYLMIGKAGRQIASALHDKEALAQFAAWESEDQGILDGMNGVRDLENRKLQMGGAH